MDKSLLKNRSVFFILLCLLVVASIYAVDVFHLAYNMVGWDQFGALPIRPSRLAYLEADTPNVISYREPGDTEPVTCAEAVAYLETTGGTDITRCCQTETNVSCLGGDFSADIPPADETCVASLRETFGVEGSLQVFAACPEGGNPEMTVVQMDSDGNISWKHLTLNELSILSTALRCLLAPILLGLAIRSAVILFRKPDPKKQITW